MPGSVQHIHFVLAKEAAYSVYPALMELTVCLGVQT